MKTEAFTKTYDKRFALTLPELELPEGQITAVIGSNGSGKSTMAKILAGVERPDGKAALHLEAAVGYLPQKPFAFRMSTEKNILLGGDGTVRAAELMRSLGIDALARQSAKRLSGGECARMALCRMMMRRYDLLILDEPTAAMDMESTLAAEALIRSACDEQGCALLLITHSIQQARRIADQVIFLHHGKLIEQGGSAQVLHAPEQKETRRFLDFYGV